MAVAQSNIWEGTLYVSRNVAGVLQPRQKWPGLAKFAIKPNADIKQAIAKDKGKYGQAVASVGVIKPSDFSVTITQVSGSVLAMCLQGDSSAYSQGSGTITDEGIAAKLDAWVDLAKKNIDAGSVVLTHTSGSPTYVEGTDYEVNYQQGWVYFYPGLTITADQSLKIDYDYSAISAEKILGGTTPMIRGMLELDGRNLVDGKDGLITVWQAMLTPTSEVDFLSDDFIQLVMQGNMETPESKDSPFEILYGMTLS